MFQVLSLGVPLIELAFRFLVWLYIVPLTLALIGAGFMRDSLRALFRRDLAGAQRLAMVRYLAGQGVLGFGAAVLVFSLIFYRKELLQCVIGLF